MLYTDVNVNPKLSKLMLERIFKAMIALYFFKTNFLDLESNEISQN